jgi:hypothetical protein
MGMTLLCSKRDSPAIVMYSFKLIFNPEVLSCQMLKAFESFLLTGLFRITVEAAESR